MTSQNSEGLLVNLPDFKMATERGCIFARLRGTVKDEETHREQQLAHGAPLTILQTSRQATLGKTCDQGGSMSFRSSTKLLPSWSIIIYWTRLLLIFGCTILLVEPACELQRPTLSGYVRDGNILIGGTFPVHDARKYQTITFREKPAQITCRTFVSENFQWMQAMVFTIEEINRNPNLLPNITMGFWIHDSCMVIQRSLEGTLWMLTGQEEPIPNYDCWKNRPPVAIVGDATSTRSIPMARILSLYNHPQISYSASSPLLSDRNQFLSFFRTVPSDDFQSRGLAQLLLHFEWTWVGLLADDDDYGLQGLYLLQKELAMAGACVDFSENIVTSRADKNAFHIVQVIKNSSANAIVIFSNAGSLVAVMDEMVRQNVTGKVFVATEGWSTSSLLVVEKYSKVLAGTIGFEIYSGEMPGFEEYLTSIHPSKNADDIFVREFWEETFGCKLHNYKGGVTTDHYNVTQLCTGAERLERLQINPSGVTNYGLPYKIYNAVYSIALSLQDLNSCRMSGDPVSLRTCADIMGLKPWQLLHYIKHVHVPEKGGHGYYFDEQGNPPAQYDVINWQYNREGILRHVKVGTYDSSAPPGETLKINISAVQWSARGTQGTEVPVSVCSPKCPTGSRKVAKEGQPSCCFLCVLCPLGEISNETDSIHCYKCPWDQWPNHNQSCCIPRIIEFLHYEDPLGATLTATSILSSIVPLAILGLFIHYRKTPIVRANNHSLSCILLLSLSLCFLCTLAFIGHPTQEKCRLRQVSFGITFALCVSCILAKTVMVIVAFNASKPNSDLRKWVGPHLSCTVIIVCTVIQVLICASWLSLASPYSQYNIISKPGVLILECNEGSLVAFWCMLGYLGFLATTSFIVAYLARNLPDSFNEAKYITFSMLAFISVWITFIPAYLSTKGKYMVAMEIFAILSSTSSLISCIFFPKCYIILFKPELNTKEHLMGRTRGKSNKKKVM
ncbi:extracellular calcium-sensing receptor-like [Lissotriton helveticus]